MYLLLSKVSEELPRDTYMLITMIVLGLVLMIIVSVSVDRLLNKLFHLEHHKHVHGYIKKRYVNKVHQIGTFIFQSIIVVLIAYMGIKNHIRLDLLNLVVTVVFVAIFLKDACNGSIQSKRMNTRKRSVSF